MKLKYVNEVRANIQIATKKSSSNILDGTYKSIYRGKSLNFESLREYIINDDIKDIDWKASARSGGLLVKQYIAEKKHNIMLCFDSGEKMDGVTPNLETKKDVLLYSAGTLGYLGVSNGDYIGSFLQEKGSIAFNPFKYNIEALEEYLSYYDKYALEDSKFDLDTKLKHLYRNIKKRMIIFVFTDLVGLSNVSENTIKEIKTRHDLMFVLVEDAFMYGDNVYDIDKRSYLPKIFTKDKKMVEVEKEVRNKLKQDVEFKLKKNNIDFEYINYKREIPYRIINLLERHKNGTIIR